MATKGRTLKVYLASDMTRLRRGLAGAESRLSRFGRTAGLALGGAAAAAGAFAVKLGVDGVKAAVDDEQSQSRLAVAARNTTKATKAQIAALEDYITTAQRKTGLDDGALRTGLARLMRSTKDATRAQQLSDTALEISLATGKDYEVVANALARANDGQTTSLKKLGITIPESAQNYADLAKANKDLAKYQAEASAALDEYGPKSDEYASAMKRVNKQLDKVATIKGNGTKWVADLNKQFKGSVAADASTYAGATRRVATAFSELQEAFGGGVLGNGKDAGQNMGDLADAMYEAQPTAAELGKSVASLAQSLADALVSLGPLIEGLNTLNSSTGGLMFTGLLGAPARAQQILDDQQGVIDRGGRAPLTPAQLTAMAEVLSANRNPSASGSPNRPWTTFDPARYMSNANLAATRANSRNASLEARTGNRP